MEVLKLIKDKYQLTRKELLGIGLNDYRIKKLVTDKILIKDRRANYQVNNEVVKKYLLESLLENTNEVTITQLVEIGLSNYEIQELLKNNGLFGIDDYIFVPVEPLNEELIKHKEKETLESLWENYESYKKTQPLLAKEYLEKYKQLCKEHKVEFNYYELIKIDTIIANSTIDDNQLQQETKIANEIRSLLLEKPNPANLNRLKKLVTSYTDIHKDRTFYSKYYEGCYKLLNNHPKDAISIFKTILKENPENIIVLKKLCEAYFKNKNIYACCTTINQYNKYMNDNDYDILLLQVRCYLRKKEYHKITPFSYSISQRTRSNQACLKYLNGVIKAINAAIADHQRNLCYEIYSCKSIANNIRILTRILEEHNEMIGNILCDNPKIVNSIIEEYSSRNFEEEMRNQLVSEDGNIDPSMPMKYIENLNISLDEKMLMYLATARILFEKKLPTHAEQYMKLVEREKEKSNFVKKQYNLCQKNKLLYLNK